MEEIVCALCKAPIDAQNIDRRLAVARCTHCNGLTDISDTSLMTQGRAEVPLPKGISIHQGNQKLQIVVRWFTWSHLMTLGGTVIGPLIIYHFFMNKKILAFLDTWVLLFIGASWLAGFYAAIAKVINRTTVTIYSNVLRVRHWPILWFPMTTLISSDLEQIYCRKREVTKSSRNSNSSTTITVFDVVAVKTNGRTVDLMRSLETHESALFLEQEIERALDICDRPVGGEEA